MRFFLRLKINKYNFCSFIIIFCHNYGIYLGVCEDFLFWCLLLNSCHMHQLLNYQIISLSPSFNIWTCVLWFQESRSAYLRQTFLKASFKNDVEKKKYIRKVIKTSLKWWLLHSTFKSKEIACHGTGTAVAFVSV